MFMAYFIYVKNEDKKFSEKLKFTFQKLWNLSFGKLFVDEIYQSLIINPLLGFCNFLVDFVEKYIIDGFVRAVGIVSYQSSVFLKTIRGAELQSHIFFMVIGATLIITIIFSNLMNK